LKCLPHGKTTVLPRLVLGIFRVDRSIGPIASGDKCGRVIVPAKLLRKSTNNPRFGNLATGAFTVIRYFPKIFLN
jgi:hypothetical protein